MGFCVIQEVFKITCILIDKKCDAEPFCHLRWKLKQSDKAILLSYAAFL